MESIPASTPIVPDTFFAQPGDSPPPLPSEGVIEQPKSRPNAQASADAAPRPIGDSSDGFGAAMQEVLAPREPVVDAESSAHVVPDTPQAAAVELIDTPEITSESDPETSSENDTEAVETYPDSHRCGFCVVMFPTILPDATDTDSNAPVDPTDTTDEPVSAERRRIDFGGILPTDVTDPLPARADVPPEIRPQPELAQHEAVGPPKQPAAEVVHTNQSRAATAEQQVAEIGRAATRVAPSSVEETTLPADAETAVIRPFPQPADDEQTAGPDVHPLSRRQSRQVPAVDSRPAVAAPVPPQSVDSVEKTQQTAPAPASPSRPASLSPADELRPQTTENVEKPAVAAEPTPPANPERARLWPVDTTDTTPHPRDDVSRGTTKQQPVLPPAGDDSSQPVIVRRDVNPPVQLAVQPNELNDQSTDLDVQSTDRNVRADVPEPFVNQQPAELLSVRTQPVVRQSPDAESVTQDPQQRVQETQPGADLVQPAATTRPDVAAREITDGLPIAPLVETEAPIAVTTPELAASSAPSSAPESVVQSDTQPTQQAHRVQTTVPAATPVAEPVTVDDPRSQPRRVKTESSAAVLTTNSESVVVSENAPTLPVPNVSAAAHRGEPPVDVVQPVTPRLASGRESADISKDDIAAPVEPGFDAVAALQNAQTITPADTPVFEDSAERILPSTTSELSNVLQEEILEPGKLAAGEQKEIQIRFDPPRLGRVRLVVSRLDDEISVKVFAISPLSRDVIEHDLPAIRDAIDQAGIQLGEFHVEQETAQQSRGEQDAPHTLPFSASSETESEQDSPSTTTPDSDSNHVINLVA